MNDTPTIDTEPVIEDTPARCIDPDEPMMSVGQILAHWRMEAGLTQADVSKLADCPRSSVSNIETGRTFASADYILTLAHLGKRHQKVVERLIIANALHLDVPVADLEPPAEPTAKDTEFTLKLLLARKRILAGERLTGIIGLYSPAENLVLGGSIGPSIEVAAVCRTWTRYFERITDESMTGDAP